MFDTLLANDTGDDVCLVLLDMTAELDTADQSILLARLQHQVGISGSALELFRLYLYQDFLCLPWLLSSILPNCHMAFHRVQCWNPCCFHFIWFHLKEWRWYLV